MERNSKYVDKRLLLTALFLVTILETKAQLAYRMTLSKVIDTLALQSPEARITALQFENELLQFENYKKSFLPSVSISISPVSFNRSIVKLQQASDGQYNFVEDYSSSSSAGISIQQKIPFTGGTLSANSGLGYLNELSHKRHSFNANPFSISYSQQLFGSAKPCGWTIR